MIYLVLLVLFSVVVIMDIQVHPLTSNPTLAWKELSKKEKVIKIKFSPPKYEVPTDKMRVVCMSDTHSLTSRIKFDIPLGDVFIHAGDFTKCGKKEEVIEFNEWLGRLPHKHKIAIAGNHELSFDPTFTHPLEHTYRNGYKIEEIPTLGMPRNDLEDAVKIVDMRDNLTNCTYLEDSCIVINGVKIYGTPWQPEFCKWAFNLPRGEKCLEKWNLIPNDTDILITHSPPVGHGDLCYGDVRAGCVELLSTVRQRVKPKYHVFGHIHESYGITTDGEIIFINAATCNINYLPVNPPIVFDVKLPDGFKKT